MVALGKKIIEALKRLSASQQRDVLDFARSLIFAQGIPGDDLIARAHDVGFSPADLAEMSRAIDEGCENIDPRDWDPPFFPA